MSVCVHVAQSVLSVHDFANGLIGACGQEYSEIMQWFLMSRKIPEELVLGLDFVSNVQIREELKQRHAQSKLMSSAQIQ